MIKPNTLWRNMGGLYRVLSIGKMKVDTYWLYAVTYQAEDGATYTRKMSEFLDKFVEMEE